MFILMFLRCWYVLVGLPLVLALVLEPVECGLHLALVLGNVAAIT